MPAAHATAPLVCHDAEASAPMRRSSGEGRQLFGGHTAHAVSSSNSNVLVGLQQHGMALDAAQPICENCWASETGTWRHIGGVTLCNACGLYAKTHSHHRPAALFLREKRRKPSKGRRGQHAQQQRDNTDSSSVTTTTTTDSSSSIATDVSATSSGPATPAVVGSLSDPSSRSDTMEVCSPPGSASTLYSCPGDVCAGTYDEFT